MNIGEIILIERRRKGLTQTALAKLSGVRTQTIWGIENGKTPTFKNMYRIAEALNCEVEINFKPKIL